MQTQITMLPVEKVHSSANVRFGLKKYRVESLAASILELGGIQEPITVYPADKKGEYTVLKGNYRRAAAEKVNKDGAGIQLPCMIVDAPSALDRLKLQVAENVQREDMSPMDIGVAAKEALAQGLSRTEVRNMFIRTGGRKGNVMTPISNSLLNIYMSFLDLPKSTQNLIHDGVLPVRSAMELMKHPKDKWEAIIDRCKENFAKEQESEEKADQKLLEDEKRAEAKAAKDKEREEKLKAEKAKLAELQKEAEVQSAIEKEKREKAGELFLSKPKLDKEALAAAEKQIKELEAEATIAKRKQSDALKAAEKAQMALDKATAAEAERKQKAEEAAKRAARKTISESAVREAAAAEGSGLVKLKAPEMRAAIAELMLPGAPPKVAAIASSIMLCFDSALTNAQLLSELSYITGERKEKPKTITEREKAAKAAQTAAKAS